MLEPERDFLWGICYRMTGSASDAEDLVQETFVRAMEHPPPDATIGWRPWLVRVSMNLARDQLRKRKRRSYPGIWLPTPVETPEGVPSPFEPASLEASPEARYSLLESATFAFLVAVEVLTPSQRAVLLLRDVFDYSSAETAEMLELSEENVRITLHRARRAMADYERERLPLTKESIAAIESTLYDVLTCISSRNIETARHIFADDLRAMGDGGGIHHVGRGTVLGREKIVKMYAKLATKASSEARVEIRRINGLPAVIIDDPGARKPNGPRVVLLFEFERSGKVRTMFSVLSPAKLARVRWPHDTAG